MNIHGHESMKPFFLPLIISTAFFTASHVELRDVLSNNTVQLSSAAFAQNIPAEGPIRVSKTYHEIGYNYSAPGKFGTLPDSEQAPTTSKVKVFENGIELGPAHSVHADIRSLGKGRFSHWKGSDGSIRLYFSSSDNTDPRTNGRLYTYRIDSQSSASPTTASTPPGTTTPTPTPTTNQAPTPTTTPSTSPTTSPTTAPAPTPPPTGTGQVFYVSPNGSDSNPGTRTAPWRTVLTAALKLAEGDTAVLLDGMYEEPSIRFANSGTPGSPITILAENKWKAIVSTTSGCNPAFSIDKSYITIQDIRITVSPNNVICGSLTTNIPAAIRAWGSNVPSVGNPTTGTAGFVARGIYVDYSAAFALGIKTNQDYSLVENSEIHNSLEGFNSVGTIFRNNVLYEADVFGSTITTKGGMRNVQVYNNVVHVTQVGWNEGLVLGGTSGAQWDFEPAVGIECYNCAAWNNVVINETGTSRDLFVMAACQDCVMSNNVGINGSLAMRGGGGNMRSSPNPTWKNNIITCNGSATSSWNGSGTVLVDYNDFFKCNSALPAQPHGIVGDPKFVNPSSDWHQQPGSPASGAGVEVTVPGYNGSSIDVSRDRDGNIRSVPWNLGIY